jgi:hypothetical protein
MEQKWLSDRPCHHLPGLPSLRQWRKSR